MQEICHQGPAALTMARVVTFVAAPVTLSSIRASQYSSNLFAAKRRVRVRIVAPCSRALIAFSTTSRLPAPTRQNIRSL